MVELRAGKEWQVSRHCTLGPAATLEVASNEQFNDASERYYQATGRAFGLHLAGSCR